MARDCKRWMDWQFPKSRPRLHRLHMYAKGMPVLFMVVPCCLSVEISPGRDSWKGMCGHGLQLFNFDEF